MTRRRRDFGFGFALMLLVLACGAQPPQAQDPAPAPAATSPHVVLPDGFRVEVEVASDPDTRATGLMYRPSLNAGKGMLFLFPEPAAHGFWMKNTLIPLDMIWIDATGRVVDVEADVPPCKADPCPTYGPEGKASYVLELAGGEAARHGVVPGASVAIRNVEQYIVR
ncbi:MAG: DUF192 domain-containing protein [Thermoanaerobaculia bacterium]